MPLQVSDNGANNVVRIAPDFAQRSGGRIAITGNHNYIEIGMPQVLTGEPDIHVANGSGLSIAADCILGHLFIHIADRGRVVIGHTTRFNGQVRLLLHEPGAIEIGLGCLFGGGVDVTISDMHSIVSLDTGERINPPRNIKIGENVWVGQHATILKGVTIGNGAIIGASAVVTSDVPDNCAVAGNPARVVRERVTWREELL
jgi:acetyltransferase-like isoleucine patch superfamily enzyme